jgi:hypothetical protein
MNYMKAAGISLAVFLITSSANAGPTSTVVRTALHSAKDYVETRVPMLWPKQAGKKAAEGLAKRIAGEDATLAERLASQMSGKSETEIAEFSSWWKQAEDGLGGIPATGREQAVDFLWRTQREGALVIKRFRWEKAVEYGLTKQGAEPVVKEAGKLIEPGLDHSWLALRNALAKAPVINRDFAEKLFLDRAAAKRIEGLENVKLFEGQHNGLNGIDFMGMAEKGRIKVIEFSTGVKPGGEPTKLGLQMEWPWITENMKKFVRGLSEDQRINLRAAGFPNDWLLDAERITETRVKSVVDREFYAVESDSRLLRRLEKDGPVKFNCLEPAYRGCKAA